MAQKTTTGPQTIYITRWALTRGILQAKAEITEEGRARIALTFGHSLLGKGDFALSLEEANKKVAQMAKRRLQSIDKSRAKVALVHETAKAGSYKVNGYFGAHYGAD